MQAKSLLLGTTHLLKKPVARSVLATLGLLSCVARAQGAGFTPITLDPTSYNQDPVIERTAPPVINDFVTVTPDQGTNKSGNTWFEVGYNTTNLNMGLPAHNSLVTTNNAGTTRSYTFQMPPDYTVNNCIFAGHNNSSWTPILHPQGGTPGTFTLTTPHPYNSISVLNGSGNGACVIYYVVHFSDGTTQTGTFSSTDWWSGNASSAAATRVYDAHGLVGMGGGVNNPTPNHGVLWANDIDLNNTTANVTSVDFFWQYGSSNGHSPWGNGRTVIFGLAGSTDATLGGGGTFNPVAVTGYDQDVVVEATAPPTTGTSADTNYTGVLIKDNTYCSVTMDGNVAKTGSTWFEAGYYASYPNTGLPQAGTTITSLSKPEIQYTMPSTYVGNCAYFLTGAVTNPAVNQATIKFASPTAAGSLAFLVGGGNGGLNIRAEIQFQGGASETNWIVAPDWFTRDVTPPAYVCFGRMAPSNRSVNNTPDQFGNDFLPVNQIGGVPVGNIPGPLPFSRDPRNGGPAFQNLPGVRLYDSVFPVANSSTPISSINLYCTNTSGGNSVTIFAVSGSPGMPPVINRQPFTIVSGADSITNGSATLNNIVLTKGRQGIDNFSLIVSNVGSADSYQWKRAPRGGGWRDLFLTDYDMSTFANVAGPNISVTSGGNYSILTISNATLADSADYLAVLSNAYGMQTSFVATVMVLTTNLNLLVGQGGGDTITKWSGDGTSGNGQETYLGAIDQQEQKWLSTGLGGLALDGSSAIAQGTVPFATLAPQGSGVSSGIGYTVTPVNGKSICTSLRFFCANDTQGRDPLDYTLEGSNDGTTWSRITGGTLTGTLMLPVARGGSGSTPCDPMAQPVMEVDFANATQYASYRVTITNVTDDLGTPLMQVAEIQMLGTPITTPPAWVRQPVPSVTVFAGTSPTWGVQASGVPAPKYQWFTNGVAVPGATSTTFTLANVQLGQDGTTVYATAVNLGGGPIQSSSSTLHVIPAPSQTYPIAVLANNPIGYWRLDETPDDGFGNVGVVTKDYAGGHNGYYSNVVIGVSGYNTNSDLDTAASFGTGSFITDSLVDDINDVDFARGTNAPGATFSLEAWVYGGNEAANVGIVTKGYFGGLAAGTGTGTEQYALDYPTTGFRFLVRDFFGNGYAAQSSVRAPDPILGTAKWHHLVGVCDQPHGSVYLYVDGLLAAQATMPTNVGILKQPLPMNIGSRKSTQGASDYDQQWVGTIDEVAMYGTALTAAQVQAQYYAAQQPPLFSLQPVNVHTNANVTMTLTSYAYGAGTISYQWYNSDGFNPTTQIAGQTSSNYTFTTTAGQSGNSYQVVAANAFGSVTSAVSTLTIESGLPAFVFQDLPAAQTVFIGHVIQLHVAPSGTAPFTYQWTRNSVPLSDDYRTSGTHTDTLTIGYATNSDSASYAVQVSNSVGGPSASTTDVLTVTTNSGGFFGAGSTTADWQLNNASGNPAILYATNAVELTHNLGNTANAAFLLVKQNVTSFKCAFVYQFVQGTGGADGVSFCMQNDTRGASAVGGGGGGLAVSGITPSLALELNIYSPNTFGIALNQNGATGNYSSISPVLLGQNSNPIRVDVTYDGTTLQAKFTDQVALTTFTTSYTVNIPTIVGGNSAYVGFTGADGGVNSTQIVSWNTGGSAATPIRLNFSKSGNNLILSWPSKNGAFLLQKPSLGAPWAVDQTDTFSVVGANSQVTVPLQSAAGQFFSLQIWP